MDIDVDPSGLLRAGRLHKRCALGRSGVRRDKVEGDGATPAGCFALRRVLYRPDRVAPPETALDTRPLRPEDGWCDDPKDAAYNRPVTLPYPASTEAMWREDELYDVVIILGHNDDPPVTGQGSAIFMHVARSGYAPTEGCVALALPDLLAVLRHCAPGDRVCISAPDGSRK